MLSNTVKIMCALVFSVALLAQTGCGLCGTAKGCTVTKTTKAPCASPRNLCDREPGEMTAELPPNAKVDECYARVFIPAQFKTVTERVLVRDASETIEVIPAKYEWVEEKVLVKDASTQLVAVDAEFAARERTLQVNAGHTGWEYNEECVVPGERAGRDVICLRNHAAAEKTIQVQTQVKPASVQEICVPAQYETVRRQKLVCAATTRKVCIPAEYQNVEKTQKVCDARMAWKRVACEIPGAEKVAVNASGKTSTVTVNTRVASRP